MSKIIIGIHGLSNKPPKSILTDWWQKSIVEGLERVNSSHSNISFEMVYWADILHEQALNPDLKNEKDELFMKEPYVPFKNNSKQPGKIKSTIFKYIEEQLDQIFLSENMILNFSGVTDKIIQKYFSDLERYYSEDMSIRDKIREKLKAVLKKHKGKEIMLISHSMGSIISYDVLIRAAKDLGIHTFITIGSPLGLPVVVSRIYNELQEMETAVTQLKVPECIQSNWYNISDPEDLVALDHTLEDDYAGNSIQIRARDIEVHNDYEINGERNPHKIYGYLRTLEAAQIIDDFLTFKETTWLIKNYSAVKHWLIKSFERLKFKRGQNEPK